MAVWKSPGHYVKKPIVIKAVRWTGEENVEVDAFFTEDEHKNILSMVRARDYDAADEEEGTALYALVIKTLEGEMTAQPGDWIIRGVRGELYPVAKSIFEETYEPAE